MSTLRPTSDDTRARRTGSAREVSPERRSLLKWAMMSGGAALASLSRTLPADAATMAREERAQGEVERATRGMPAPRIKDLKVIEVGGGGINDSTVVKVTTDQAGLYGYGCATTTFPGGRAKLVAPAVEQYLKRIAERTAPPRE